jgi:hypothetical protein
LRRQLLASEEGVELMAFFESCPTRGAMICALLAVLELVRLQAVVLSQSELFGAILLRKHKMFDVFFSGGKIEYSEDGAQRISPAGEPHGSSADGPVSARGESSAAPGATDDLDTP